MDGKEMVEYLKNTNIVTYGSLSSYAGQEQQAQLNSGSPSYFVKNFDRKISISFDTIEHDPTADFKVLMQCESPTMYIALTQKIIDNHKNFDLILTYDERLFHLPNARKFLPTASWIKPNIETKEPLLTFLMSSKRIAYHHIYRFKAMEILIATPNNHGIDFKHYRSPPRLERKEDLLDTAMFHVAMENQPLRHMFTEKLIDCFVSHAVPVYFGCPNIEDYFDVNGIIRFNTPDELIEIKRNLSVDLYYQMLPAVKRNLELAQDYVKYSVFQRVEKIIEEYMR